MIVLGLAFCLQWRIIHEVSWRLCLLHSGGDSGHCEMSLLHSRDRNLEQRVSSHQCSGDIESAGCQMSGRAHTRVRPYRFFPTHHNPSSFARLSPLTFILSVSVYPAMCASTIPGVPLPHTRRSGEKASITIRVNGSALR